MVLEQQQEVQEEQEKQYALCLNMIVKNESHIIKDKLTKLLQKIKFDYWVISDTGSTDKTKEIITDFFKEFGIPGEIYEDDWVDFSHNRNKALEYAYGKSKYLLVFDADDEICGDFVLPELTRDSYSLQFGSYTRPQIVNNHKRWKYVGVLHEYICSADSRIDDANTEIIKGPYHVISGRSGNRNLDSNKYLKDAIILENAYNDAVNAKDDIYIRYGYYCANSYYDCDKYENAISWYKKTLENGGWYQEKYMSCLKLYNCYNNLGNKETGFFYLVKSAEYDRERAECYYELIKYYSCSGLYDIAYGYYGVLRDFYENSYLKDGLNNKLFVDMSISEFHLPYYFIIVCEKMRDYQTGIHMYRIIFTKKCKIFDEWFIGNLIYNLQFFIEHVKEEDKTAFYSLFQEYVDFLVANNYPLFDETIKIYKKYGIKKREASIAIDEECLNSKKILIYTGFMGYLWNDTHVSNHAIGGAEKAVAYLARNLPKEYEIIISGDVADEVVGNVRYVNRFKLQALLDVEKIHTIIVSRYVSFFILFPQFNCHQLYLSAHDTGFLNNFNDVPVNSIIEENNKYINGVICLTTWHKLNVIQSHPCLKDKVSIINNGILVPVVASSDGAANANASLSHNISHNNKIKNKFVWTSCSSRGLDVLLKLWDKILEVMPDATLDISSYDAFPNPNRNKDEEIQKLISHHSDSVTHYGKLNTLQLHDLISKAEYWLYTCTFYETSCITALEMLMHEVVCLYYPLAGLNETIGKYGIQVIPGTEIKSIVNLSEERKAEMRINGKKYAMSCSWENRAKEWACVLGLNNNRRVYDLHNNYTIPQNHISYLKKLKYNFKPKIIYDIGANVLNWTKEAKNIWNDAEIIVFDAIKSAEFLYNEHNYKYHIGVLSDADDKIVKFYENSEHPAGNSYYKEVGHEKSNELYPENKFTEQLSTTLARVVKNNIFSLPDLIKFDVQGCELDIIKGSIDIVNHARYLIVELQTMEYNKGAPLADETIKFLEDNNWELLTKTPFCDNGPDGDYCFKNNRTINKQKWVFYTGNYIYTPIVQYLENFASNEIEVEISNDVNYINNMKLDKLIILLTPFGRGLLDKNILNQFNHISISFLQLEPLNLYSRLNEITNEFNSYPDLKKYSIYDYSKSNIKILNNNGITKCKHLPYKCTPSELNLLRKCNSAVKEYDFGFIYDWKLHNNGLKSLPIKPPRRNKIMEFLINNGFTVNLIAGYGEDRDTELGKCKIILNPHGQINENPTPSPSECSNIFEHIRCDRLLEAGFTILSETSYDLCPEFVKKYPNLKLIEYEDFFNLDVIRNILTKKWYCFIHSCHLNGKGLNRLDYLMTSLKKNDLFSKFETIYINNIGLPVEENRYGTMVDICNYSDNPMLCEIPTINKIQHFSQTNPNCNILYLHTKGICYDDNNQKINDWIDMMLYFLVEKYELCISKLDSGIQTVGCNYFDVKNPPHFSGNFWWSKSSYIYTLPLLIESEFASRNDAEFWLCKNNPTVYELHNSKIDQYFELYPPTMYHDDKQKIDVYIKNNKMIVDCFTFYNELDMLTYRLNILDKVVDYFVLVESTHTHVGKEKPLFYNENKHLFKKFNHKIIHIVVDDFPHKYPNINIEKQEQWINERFQRDCISRGIDKLNLTGEDIITITDLDEIPNPNILTQIKNNIIIVGINIIELDFYYYNLNSMMDHKWYHSKILTFEKYKELNTGCDNIRFYNSPIINNAGWHLSYFGNEKFIKNKLENFTHQEYNMTEFTDEKRIEERIKNGKDLFDRPNSIIHINIEDNNNLPPDYDIYLKNYYNICYEDEKVEVKLNSNKKEMDLNKFNNGGGIFIQIGAGAGDLDERANCRDGFTELVKKLPRQSIKKIILVEPNPLNIPLLKKCWKDYPESIIYEIGIVPKNYQNNTIDLYYCPLDAPHYQVASINKSHVQKHYGDNCEIEKFIIPVKQLENFINEITTEEIDLLALDIEGIDAEILLDINFNNLKLKYLSFEHLHLGEYKENVLNHLKNNNYEFVGSGVDHNGYDYLYINGHYNKLIPNKNIIKLDSNNIPKKIFQTWETTDIEPEFQQIIDKWKYHNPTYEYIFHNAEQRVEFIRNNFEKNVLDAYKKIIPGAYKCDLWRYCVLYIYGGFYADIDTLCMGKLNSLTNENIEFIVPIDLNINEKEGQHNLACGFIGSVPKSQILLDAINMIIFNVENNIIPTSKLDFSGPGLLGRAVNKFLKLDETTSFKGKEGIQNNINFLEFDANTEYMRDVCTNINILQNKNKNSDIVRLYNNECNKIKNYACWLSDNVIVIDNILKKKWYCFIHSCHLKEKGLNRLDYLITSLKSNDLFSKFETIYINNIGLPIEENRYGPAVDICNYSDNPDLYEIPTINKIQHFSQTNADCNILYLHTKGVRSGDDQKVNDWIDVMLFFLVKKYELCISKLNSGIQAVGCNYSLNCTNYIYHAPTHFSGNFWWTNTNYTKTLPPLIEKTENVVSYDAEFWLCKNNPTVCDLHNSNINHYYELYPSTMYDDKKMITNLTCITCNEMCDMCDMFQMNDTLTGIDNVTFYYGVDNKHIDITSIVFTKCITNHKIVIPSGDECRASIFGDTMFGIVKKIYMIVNNHKYCKITHDYYTCIDMVNKKCQIDIANECINTHNIVFNKLEKYASAWLGHMNFACWLVKLLNPCVVVDLGVDFGHSTFAFAAAQLGCVYGVDSFEGDIQAGIKNTYEIVNNLKRELIQDNLLIDNIHFIKGYFDDVYNTFDKTIDILHIDGLHTLDAVTNDYNTWITKTSDDAVILFHDVVSYPDTVGKLFNSIQYPKFYFTHSAGLGVVCKNSHTLNNILTSADIPNKECIQK